MKIVVLDGYAENPGDLSWAPLEALGEVTVYDRTSLTDEKETIVRLSGAEIAVTNKTPITRRVIDACPRLRYITMLATGYNVVDAAYAREKGIPLSNIPTYGTAAVGQFAIALLLEICHHAAHHSDTVHAGKWAACADWCYWDYPLIELDGKTMGIIGFGRIGQQTGRIARALGMRVLACGSHPSDSGRAIADYVELDALLAASDVIALHCPLFPETEGIINRETIRKMKDGVVLVNTSRGGLVKTEDLIEGIRARKFFAVGLDVYEEEKRNVYEDRSDEILESSVTARLLSFPNVLITSHQGFFTEEALGAISETTLKNAVAFEKGETTGNEVE